MKKDAMTGKKDLWTVLEEFDAPMWVDLILETKPSSYDDTAHDSWFYAVHPFHTRSSRQLKAEYADFSYFFGSPAAKSKVSDSPKLPSSVSRSRGKMHGNTKSRGYEEDLLRHEKGLNKVPSVSASGITALLTSQSSICEYGNSAAKENFGQDKSRIISMQTAINLSSNPSMKFGSENIRSTINSESSCSVVQLNQEACSGSQRADAGIGLVSSFKASLRKSCAIRQPSRASVCVKDDSAYRKSISGKSSVGSSSSFTFAVTQSKDKTPESRSNATSAANIAAYTRSKSSAVNRSTKFESNVAKSSSSDAVNPEIHTRPRGLGAPKRNMQIFRAAGAVKGRDSKENKAEVAQTSKNKARSTMSSKKSTSHACERKIQPSNGGQPRLVTRRPHFR